MLFSRRGANRVLYTQGEVHTHRNRLRTYGGDQAKLANGSVIGLASPQPVSQGTAYSDDLCG